MPSCEATIQPDSGNAITKRRLAVIRLRAASLFHGTWTKYEPKQNSWPKKLDRELVEELLTLEFLKGATNVILVGPNGGGKTMIAKNLLHQAVLRGHNARLIVASDMLHDLAALDSSTQLARRLRRYTSVPPLCIDESATCRTMPATPICCSRSSRVAINSGPSC